MKKGICKLCQKSKKLCKQSHIIPDFMYQDLLSKEGNMVKAEAEKGIEEIEKIQTGDFDKGILCETCDNEIIGQYESYASKVLYGGRIPIKMKNFKVNKYTYTEVRNLNYKKFKLFLLSILWRASISGRYFFESVSLGPYEEELRLKIFKGDPGDVNEFPIFLRIHKDKFVSELIGSPIKIRIKNNIAYKFQISNIEYVFKVSKNEKEDFFSKFTINKDNTVKIIHATKENTDKYIEKLYKNFS